MLTKRLTARIATSGVILSIFCFVRPVLASNPPGLFTFNIAPDGAGNVVVSGSGDANLGTATEGTNNIGAQISPVFDTIVNGPTPSNTSVAVYTFSALSGPGTFGSTGTGPTFGFIDPGFGFINLYLPTTYTSDSPITDSATYTGKTLTQLGLTPGTSTWTMATGISGITNTVTINISSTPAPEPATFVLAGLSGAMLFLGRLATRKR